ncbi:hypothetical protein STEG23_030075, partial [Scotinomys teguina]
MQIGYETIQIHLPVMNTGNLINGYAFWQCNTVWARNRLTAVPLVFKILCHFKIGHLDGNYLGLLDMTHEERAGLEPSGLLKHKYIVYFDIIIPIAFSYPLTSCQSPSSSQRVPVTRILKGLIIKKNPELVIGIKAERSEEQNSQSLVYLYEILRLQR